MSRPDATVVAAAGRFAPLYPYGFILVWGSAFVAVRAGLPDVSPFYFLSLRFSLAATVLLALAVLLRRRFAVLRGVWPHLAVAGALTSGLYLAFAYQAMTTIPGATFALIGSLQPLLVAVLSIPLLGDRFRPAQWLGFGLGIAGVVLVLGVEAADAASRSGIAWGVAGVAMFVAGTLYYARFCRAAPLLQANAVQFAAAALCAWALTALCETPRAAWTPTAVATLLYLALVVSLGGMGLLFSMLKTGTAGRVSANFYLTPGVTALLAWAVLGETVAPLAVPGFLVACAGLWLVNRKPALPTGGPPGSR